MLCIYNPSTDPYFNLAAEEYLLKEFRQDIFMLWRNHNSIIVGKHQNTLAEINYDFVRENGIKVVRRLSGGGTVFHDLGNLNFTFIQTGEGEHLVDFRRYTQPILEVLSDMGIEARFEGRNDLTIEGRKFSGNAEHVYRDRVLHHGTLLFASEIADLTAALKVNPAKFHDKAVKSVRSRVTNISEHLREPMDISAFTQRIMAHVTSGRADSQAYTFSPDDEEAIRQLVRSRYSTWEWNFGYSPRYDFIRSFSTSGGHVEVHFDVKDGIIREARIFGDFFHIRDTAELENLLTGLPHEYEALRQALHNTEVGLYIRGCTADEFLQGLF
ncbi:MAG TPA: lipoate--protein ligase [Bacteroidales bacterium]|nr:lipoate--protein ligase [Bacteroidales bacterium]HRZ75815.1 lipoate--protein ligase [Bacteroidales bacterium]